MTELGIMAETNTKVRPFYKPDDEKFKRINYRVTIKEI